MFLTAAAADGNLGTVGRTGMHVILHVIGTRCVGVSTPLGLWITHEPTGADRGNPRFSRCDHPHFDKMFAPAAVHFVDVLRFGEDVGWRRRLESSPQRVAGRVRFAGRIHGIIRKQCAELGVDVRIGARFRRRFHARFGRLRRTNFDRPFGRACILEGSSRSRAWRCSAAGSGTRRRPGRSRNGGGARRARIRHARVSGGRDGWASCGSRGGSGRRRRASDGRRGR